MGVAIVSVVSRKRVWLVGVGGNYGCGLYLLFLQQHPYFFFILLNSKKKNNTLQNKFLYLPTIYRCNFDTMYNTLCLLYYIYRNCKYFNYNYY